MPNTTRSIVMIDIFYEKLQMSWINDQCIDYFEFDEGFGFRPKFVGVPKVFRNTKAQQYFFRFFANLNREKSRNKANIKFRLLKHSMSERTEMNFLI